MGVSITTPKYIYPKLPAAGYSIGFVRFGGSGLANCLFIYARAIKRTKQFDCKLIAPTWFNISIGPYLRHQSDKRHYLGLFNSNGEISGFKKMFILSFRRRKVETIEGLGPYFADLVDVAEDIRQYIELHVHQKLLVGVRQFDFSNCVAVHIRLGDYPEKLRIPISWYKQKIEKLYNENHGFRFLLFSDGSDSELSELLSLPNMQRVFFGNAIADIIAISKCCYMIGSDSTFSGWGAFLGQVPCVFYRKHYGPILKDSSKEIVESDENLWG